MESDLIDELRRLHGVHTVICYSELKARHSRL
jgi:hypothetical protein